MSKALRGWGLGLLSGLSLICLTHVAGAQAPGGGSARDTRRVDNSLDGASGLLRVSGARPGAPGTFQVSLIGSFFTGGGFLCEGGDCVPADGSEHFASDDVSRIGAHLGLSATVLPFLEAYTSFHAYSTSNDQGSPQLLQVLGDTNFGVKASLPIDDDELFRLGGLAELWLLNGVGDVGLDAGTTSFVVRGVGTVDFAGRKPRKQRLPLRVHGNLGYRWNNAGELADEAEGARGTSISRIERFGLEIDRVDSIEIGVGAEGVFDLVRPFIEWSVDVPVNRQNYECNIATAAARDDGCLGEDSGFSTTPSRLGLGARFYPWNDDFSVLAALEIGTGATYDFIEELAPELPWNAYLGVSYAVDTTPRAQIASGPGTAVARGAGPLAGRVVERGSRAPIPGASVRFENASVTGLITLQDGSFRSHELERGTYTLRVSAPGYRSAECLAMVPGPVQCELQALPKVGAVSGALLDAETGAPLSGATVRITDKLNRELELTTDAAGAFRFENVPPGFVRITVEARGYLSSVTELDIVASQDVSARIPVRKRGDGASVEVTPNELRLSKQIEFESGSATMSAGSESILAEIADVLRKRPELSGIEVQGHTDNTGNTAYNLKLSQARAEAVVSQLEQLGISRTRLQARGYGSERPLVPNSSEANRARNRRVQILITGRK